LLIGGSIFLHWRGIIGYGALLRQPGTEVD
jgi:hypothetical protein